MKRILKNMIVVFSLIFVLVLSSCSEDKLTLTVKDNVTTIAQGETIQLETNDSNATFEIKEGLATVDATGLLTCNLSAEIDSKIVVEANSSRGSAKVTLTVTQAKASAIELVSSESTISKYQSVTLSVNYNPTGAIQEEVNYELVSGDDIALITNNVLSIKETVLESSIIGQTIIIKATTKNTQLSDELEIKVVESGSDDVVIFVEDQNIIAGENAVEAILPEAFNRQGEPINLNLSDYTFTSSDESILTIGEHDGKITPVGHGKATVTVKYYNAVSTCDVYVMIVPEAIELENLSTTIMDTGKYYYSKSETLKLDVNYICSELYSSTSQKLVYNFELLNENGEVMDSGDNIATVSDGNITFNTVGNIRVTLTSDSTLNGETKELAEKSTSIVVCVNEGVNIRTIADLKAYANVINEGKIANFLNDLYITKEENFGVNDDRHYSSLDFFGDRYLYGNGYVISTEKLELTFADTNASDLLRFYGSEKEYYTVELYDLEFIGVSDVFGNYTGELEKHKGQLLYVEEKVVAGFRRAIRIGQNQDYNACRPVKDIVISNVKVSGFYVGFRLDHIVDGYVTDVNVDQCISNGFEFNQNIITLNNITVGQVGAFAIEMAPDDVDYQNDTLIPSAGLNFDQKAQTILTGYIHSDNYNNGLSTPYMTGLGVSGYTIADVASMLINGKIDYIANQVVSMNPNTTYDECYQYLSDLANKCVYKDADEQQKLINFFALVFIEPEDFLGYTGGNYNGDFGTYENNSDQANMITMNDLLLNAIMTLSQGGTYDAYKDYQYILLDLDLTSVMGVNLGEVILVNQAYVEK